MPGKYSEVASAKSTRGFYKFALTHSEYLSAHETGITNPSADRKRKDQIYESWTEESDKGNREQNTGKSHEGVHGEKIQNCVDSTAIIASDPPQYDAERK